MLVSKTRLLQRKRRNEKFVEIGVHLLDQMTVKGFANLGREDLRLEKDRYTYGVYIENEWFQRWGTTLDIEYQNYLRGLTSYKKVENYARIPLMEYNDRIVFLEDVGNVTKNKFLLRLAVGEYLVTIFADGRAALADDILVVRAAERNPSGLGQSRWEIEFGFQVQKDILPSLRAVTCVHARNRAVLLRPVVRERRSWRIAVTLP